MIDARIILKAYGVPEKLVHSVYLHSAQAAEQLVTGKIDAFFMVGGLPVPAIGDAAAKAAIRLIPISGHAANDITKNYKFFSETVIPATAYPGVAAVPTLALGAQLFVRCDMDDETAYAITKALWQPATHLLLAAGHPQGKMILLANALSGIAVPLHPGAERYYREVGMVSDNVVP